MFFLGVDGGATKTAAVVIDERGRVVSRKTGKDSNHGTIGIKKAEKHLYELIKRMGKRKISCACFGLAGIDSRQQYNKMYSMLKKGRIGRLLKCPIILVNDTQIILPSVGMENGIAVIGGTGCNFYARNGRREAWASGLGHILSDQGSAYDIAVMVLRSAVKSFDGRGSKTILERLVLSKARIRNMRNLVDVIYTNTDKKSIADYAPLAEKAARKGDAVARQILSEAADEYVLGIRAVARRTGLRKFNAAVVGGVFKNRYILSGIRKKLRKARILIVKDPSLGAAKLAMKEARRE